FMGYDFHISPHGPRLIEVNTNAGGAFLNVAAREVQQACCEAADDYLLAQPGAAQLQDEIVAMFRREWRLARGDQPLQTIAIVDENPRAQFLYPEFLLARNLFASNVIRTVIVDPAELALESDRVVAGG